MLAATGGKTGAEGDPRTPPEDPAAGPPAGTAAYGGTSGFVKLLVAGLTDLVNGVTEGVAPAAAPGPPPGPKAELTPAGLLEAIREDYVDRNYLWTGDIRPDIYEDDCRWTDPTLSFEVRRARAAPGTGMHGKGGVTAPPPPLQGQPPPSRAPTPCPATALTPSASFNGICDRQ